MEGTLALDRFRLEERLGSGAFGTVHRAWDLRLQRWVAIKAIPAQPGEGARVLREAQAAARLTHPNIVTLYELGQEDGWTYLVTELVEGETMRSALDHDALADRDIAEIGADLCEALDHAHARGVIHRDLKPANILVTEPDRLAKLMDFGIASLTDEAGLTATGDVVGTLAYMAPEQAEGRAAGPEADVYSLCLVLYEAWTGSNPNRRRTPAATVRAIGDQVTPLSRLRPDLPERLCDAIDAGLDPEPEFRPGFEQIGPALEASLSRLSSRPLPGGTGRARGDGWSAAGSMIAALAGRLGFAVLLLAAAAGLWLANQAGIALLLLIALVPAMIGSREGGAGPWLVLIAPLLGLAGVASVFPAVAGLARRWRERVLYAACGCMLLAFTQVATGRNLGLGAPPEPASGWAESPGLTMREVLLPVLGDLEWLAALAIWMAAATVAGFLLTPIRAWTGERPLFRRMDGGPATAEPNSRNPLGRSR